MASDMQCPICNEAMTTLGQLNRHLDDMHSGRTDGRSAFVDMTASPVMTSVKSAIGRILKEGGELTPSASSLDLMSPRSGQVTAGQAEQCARQGCAKSLTGLLSTRWQCRRCQRMFCEEHCDCFMKLSAAGQHDSTHGVWQRVCEACFSAKSGHDECEGQTRSLQTAFMRVRQRNIDRLHLESNRLENRLEKLVELYAASASSTASPRIGGREAEKAIVPWQDDASATNCPFCFSAFGLLSNRRHHCRLCGRIICGNIACSEMLSLQALVALGDAKPSRLSTILATKTDPERSIRACMNCGTIVFRYIPTRSISMTFRKKIHLAELQKTPPIIELYEVLQRHKKAIDGSLPKFNQMLYLLGNKPLAQLKQDAKLSREYERASLLRKTLLDHFAQLDSAAYEFQIMFVNEDRKRIALLEARTQAQKRLHTSIFTATNQYLQLNMFTLQLLPKPNDNTAKDAGLKSSQSAPELPPKNPDSPHARRASMQQQQRSSKSGSRWMSYIFSSESSLPEIESDDLASPVELPMDLLNHLDILNEQKSQLEQFLADATRQRKFEDIKALQVNLNEVTKELERVRMEAQKAGYG